MLIHFRCLFSTTNPFHSFVPAMNMSFAFVTKRGYRLIFCLQPLHTYSMGLRSGLEGGQVMTVRSFLQLHCAKVPSPGTSGQRCCDQTFACVLSCSYTALKYHRLEPQGMGMYKHSHAIMGLKLSILMAVVVAKRTSFPSQLFWSASCFSSSFIIIFSTFSLICSST